MTQHSSTPTQKPLGVVLFFLALALFGCPNTGATTPTISEVRPIGNTASPSFQLEVLGRGFGLGNFQYNLGSGAGTATVADMRLQIFNSAGALLHTVPKRLISLESTRKLMAQISLSTALVPGVYRVTLLQTDMADASLEAGFEVSGIPIDPIDGGADAGALDFGDKTPDFGIPGDDTGMPPPDTGVPADMGPPVDLGPPDMGVPPDLGPPDSGLGPFQGNYQHRRYVQVGSTVDAPADVTIKIPIPHADLVTAGQSKDDGTDLALYQGPDRLDHQWDDRFALNTNGLVMVARLQRGITTGGNPADPLVLYYGDPAATNAPTDAVFTFVERFAAPLNENTWFINSSWGHCNADRPVEETVPVNHSFCFVETQNANAPVRRSIASPTGTGLLSAPPANTTYEMSTWLSGGMLNTPQEVVYFSYGPDNTNFDQTVVPLPGEYLGFAPSQPITFAEINGFGNRTLTGWTFPTTPVWWLRSLLRFTPTINQPSLHFRRVSLIDDNQDGSFFILDDWWIRLSLNPEFAPTLAPPESRN